MRGIEFGRHGLGHKEEDDGKGASRDGGKREKGALV
jgi:hypothetical protein